jgi:hypothetical protein
MATNDWRSAIEALDVIIGITGPDPDPADYPASSYDPRTTEVADIQARARLLYGQELQMKGNISAAQAQYEAVQAGEGIDDPIKQQAAASLGRLEQAWMLWNEVNRAWAASAWVQALEALSALSNLEGFGPDAQDTESDYTVEELMDMARTERDRPTPVPVQPTPVPGRPVITRPNPTSAPVVPTQQKAPRGS